METLCRVGWNCHGVLSTTNFRHQIGIGIGIGGCRTLPLLRCSLSDVKERAGPDVFHMFLNERRVDGDLVSRLSDILWIKDYENIIDSEASMLLDETPQQLQLSKDMENEDDSGLLKLTKAYEWVLGDEAAPINKKAAREAYQNDSDRRKRLNILRYDAIKREMMLLTIGVGTACTGFCLVAFSFQAAASYAVGVVLSCLYLQLLIQQVDTITREAVPQIFTKRKIKTIGIRSEDVSNVFEKVIRGSGFVLSSPRLLLPVVIYGFWGLSNHFFSSDDLLGFQLVPAFFGLFAYKAAALVQVYRDNLDLLIVFPESFESSSD
ncbi:hypothetical protein ACHQM5_018478 [Ranunculus cassubicifolius]